MGRSFKLVVVVAIVAAVGVAAANALAGEKRSPEGLQVTCTQTSNDGVPYDVVTVTNVGSLNLRDVIVTARSGSEAIDPPALLSSPSNPLNGSADGLLRASETPGAENNLLVVYLLASGYPRHIRVDCPGTAS